MTELESELLGLAGAGEQSELAARLGADVFKENWERWHNCIPEGLQSVWPRLSFESRLVAYYVAFCVADAVDWLDN